jgi:hypothetical protein
MLSEAIRAGLVAPASTEPYGEVSGAEVMQLAEDRGLDTDGQDVYARVIHIAALSDILVSAIRKPNDPAWIRPTISHFYPSNEATKWEPDCYLSPDGTKLRRITLVSNWTDARHYSECRSWFTVGEIAHLGLPMQLIVLVIGQERNGKRHTPWTTGFTHPMNRQLRFRKKSRSTSEVFNDKWEKIWREDHAEITRETWLNAMLKDDVLPEVCFKIDVPVPDRLQVERIKDMAARKMERLAAMKDVPEPNLSTCDSPPCAFRKICHTLPERVPSGKSGFIRLGQSQ